MLILSISPRVYDYEAAVSNVVLWEELSTGDCPRRMGLIFRAAKNYGNALALFPGETCHFFHI